MITPAQEQQLYKYAAAFASAVNARRRLVIAEAQRGHMTTEEKLVYDAATKDLERAQEACAFTLASLFLPNDWMIDVPFNEAILVPSDVEEAFRKGARHGLTKREEMTKDASTIDFG